MRLENYSIEKLKKEVAGIFGKYLNLSKYKVFFFGSRVKGNNFLRADIDIGVEGPEKIDPAVKLDIAEELENLPTLYKFDLVDFRAVSESFRNEAFMNIEVI